MSMIALQTELSGLLSERAKITGKIIAIYEKIRTEQEEAKTRIPDYSAYLNSDVWKAKSRAAKERAGYRCGLCYCKDAELHAHHRTYERLGMEEDTDLIVLCRACHAKFHKRNRVGGRYDRQGVGRHFENAPAGRHCILF